MFNNQYPYTDFNEYNLDWIIKTVKDLTVQWAEYKTQMDADWLEMRTDWASMKNDLEDLKTFITTYFDNLDVQEEINTKIDEMAEDGTLLALIRSTVESTTATTTTAWLSEHITEPEGVVIDDSLTIEGACADAKATGDAIADVNGALISLDTLLDYSPGGTFWVYPTNRYNNADTDILTDSGINSPGDIVSSSGNIVSGYCYVGDLDSVKLYYMAVGGVAPLTTYVVLYDNTKTKISQRLVSNNPIDTTSAAYLRFQTTDGRKLVSMVCDASLTITTYQTYTAPYEEHVDAKVARIDDLEDAIETLEGNVKTVGTGGDYTSILTALKETDASVTLHLLAQDFDIEQEYIDSYGATFWTNYDGYSSHPDDPFYRGLWLDNGRRVYGEAGTKIKFLYSGNNSAIHTYFSVFANGKNTSLENVEIFVNKNVRYSIHDDFKPADGTVTWKNIIFHGSPHSSSHIGAGLGYGATYYLEGLVFLENDSLYDVSYHGVATNNPNIYINKVYVKNCYGTKACAFRWYGPNTGVSPCIVSGSTFGSIYCEAYDSEQLIENMVLYKYNCVETVA